MATTNSSSATWLQKHLDTNSNPLRVLDDNYIYISHLDEGFRF